MSSASRPLAQAPHPLLAFWRSLRRSPATLAGMLLLAAHLLIASLAPLVVPHSPTAMNPDRQNEAPSWEHPFGTDRFGRDLFSRTLLGGRIAITISLSAAAISVLLGGFLGALFGYLGGMADELAMRVVDTLLALPSLLLLLVIVTGLGTGYAVIVFAMVLSYLPGAVRVVRAAAQEYVPLDFVTAARARGERGLGIVARELSPNLLDVLLVEFAMRASWIVLAVSGLSYLGFGVNPPTPDWGLMIEENQRAMAIAPWGVLFPVIAIGTLVVSLNLVADGIAKAVGIDRTRGVPG
jgi:peptide/nickel transport system permease protein